LWKTALWFSKTRWAAVFAVHGVGSVHAVVNSGKMLD
jgi:hypothetical protein